MCAENERNTSQSSSQTRYLLNTMLISCRHTSGTSRSKRQCVWVSEWRIRTCHIFCSDCATLHTRPDSRAVLCVAVLRIQHQRSNYKRQPTKLFNPARLNTGYREAPQQENKSNLTVSNKWFVSQFNLKNTIKLLAKFEIQFGQFRVVIIKVNLLVRHPN